MTQEETAQSGPDLRPLPFEATAGWPSPSGYRLDEFIDAYNVDEAREAGNDLWARLTGPQKRSLFEEAAYRWRRMRQACHQGGPVLGMPTEFQLGAVMAVVDELERRG